jgi:GntR family transcriptional regulator
MLLHLTDLSPEPLHEQISRQIRAQILAGTLEPGTALASIRALAREQKVSVITVQRSYDDLLRAGLLLSRRGKGFFVAPLAEQQKQDMALARVRDKLSEVVREAMAEGLNGALVRRAFNDALKEGDR